MGFDRLIGNWLLGCDTNKRIEESEVLAMVMELFRFTCVRLSY